MQHGGSKSYFSRASGSTLRRRCRKAVLLPGPDDELYIQQTDLASSCPRVCGGRTECRSSLPAARPEQSLTVASLLRQWRCKLYIANAAEMLHTGTSGARARRRTLPRIGPKRTDTPAGERGRCTHKIRSQLISINRIRSGSGKRSEMLHTGTWPRRRTVDCSQVLQCTFNAAGRHTLALYQLYCLQSLLVLHVKTNLY